MTCWLHIGDLHLTEAGTENHRDLQRILALAGGLPHGAIDFVLLPGDNADHGTPAQYRLAAEALRGFPHPVHVIPGDHDMEPGDLDAFQAGLARQRLPYAVDAGPCRCLFLDVVSAGRGGPDFRMGEPQLAWLEHEAAAAAGPVLVFMHTYPADLREGRERVNGALVLPHVLTVDMGHTHYNELANDGSTIFMATRSTGQIEEGPPGFSVAAVDGRTVSWRFKAIDDAFPFVLITSPADRRLATRVSQRPTGTVRARVLSDRPVHRVRLRADAGAWQDMTPMPDRAAMWEGHCPPGSARVEVEAVDGAGRRDMDGIEPAGPGWTAPDLTPDGSDTARLEAWPSRGLLGTQLGPNRNGKHW